MKITVTNLENDKKSFDMDINNIDDEGYDVYCQAHRVWGEQGWQMLTVSHGDTELERMINSSTMTPHIVE